MFSKKTLTILFVLTVIAIFVLDTTVAEAAVVTKGLVSYWTLDQSTMEDKTVEDIFGENDGTIMGEPEIVEGKINEALHFNRGNDCVKVESNESLKLKDAFTIETWVKGDSPSVAGIGIRLWLSKGETGGNYSFCWAHSITLYHRSISFLTAKGTRPFVRIEKSVNIGEWYHIVGSWDGSNLKIYLNGKLSNEKKVAATPVTDDVPLIIGGSISGGTLQQMFDGVVDEVKIYNRALTESEVLNNFRDRSQSLAVISASKLPTLWGRIKSGKNRIHSFR